jgi:hypothetical protein
VFDLLSTERQATGVKEVYSQFDKGDKKDQMEWSYGVNPYLRSYLIKPESPCKQDDQERGDPYRRINPKDDPKCQAPRKATRRHPAAQLTQQRTQYATAKELAQ